MRDRIRATRALTDRPFGVNLVLEWDQHERVRACAEESVAVVSTFWGDPRRYVDAIHAGGALHLHTVGSAEEPRGAVEAGVDVVVAQGWEAGGCVRVRPGSPHRALRNSTVELWERAGRPVAPRRPGEGDVVARGPDGTPVYRYGADIPVIGATGDVDALAQYAGQSAGIIRHVRPAAAIVEELVTGAAEALKGVPLQQ